MQESRLAKSLVKTSKKLKTIPSTKLPCESGCECNLIPGRSRSTFRVPFSDFDGRPLLAPKIHFYTNIITNVGKCNSSPLWNWQTPMVATGARQCSGDCDDS